MKLSAHNMICGFGGGGISTIAEKLVAVVREDPVPFEIDY